MGQEERSEKKRRGVRLSALLFIIALLAGTIVVGGIILLVSPRGKVPVTVESFTPKGEVPQATNFTIEFSQDIVSDTLVGDYLDQAPLKFSPPIPGLYKWVARHKLRFLPETFLLPSTEYTAEVLPEIVTQENHYLKGKRKFKLHTARFRIEDASISLHFGPDIKKEVVLMGEVRFNYPVEPEGVKDYLNIVIERGRHIPFEITTSRSSTSIRFESEPMERWDEDRTIHLMVSQGIRPINGNLGLYDDYVKAIPMKGKRELKVEGVFPEQRGIYGTLKIKFNAPVARDEAKLHISVDPSIEYEIVADYRYVELRGDFEAGIGYTVTVQPGLMATDGSILEKEFSTRAILQNLDPSVDFVGEGIYLSREGNLNVGLATINVEKVQIEIQKVYANNLIYLLHTNAMRHDRYGYRYGANIRNLGRQIHREEITIPRRRNEEVVTPINLKEFLDNDRIGIFSVGAFKSDQRWRSARRWVMITDLGIMTKKSGDQLLIWINSLSTLKPIVGARVTLLSRNNQTLLTGSSDSRGLVTFSSIREAVRDFEPYLILASHGEDLSFVELDRRRLSTSDFDVGGRPYVQDGFTAFLYTDRGIYRPGEKAHLVAIVREGGIRVPPPFPLRVEVLGPDNQVLHEFRSKTNDEGASEFLIELPPYIRTGRYTAKAYVGKENEIGRTAFNVEEFMPDRIKVKIETDSLHYGIGQDVPVRIEAVNLFGPPAAGRRTHLSYEIQSSRFSPPKWREFTFFDHKKSFKTRSFDMGDATLDSEGKHTYSLKLPEQLFPPSSLRGVITATVFEPGGRAVTAYYTLNLHAYSLYVGLRRLEKGYAEVGDPQEFEFIVVDRDGEVSPERECEVSFYKIVYQTVLRRSGRRGYRYISERQEILIQTFKVTSRGVGEKISVKPMDYGRYRIEVKDLESSSTSSVGFYASGWGYAPWAMDQPERLEIDLDKPLYLPGETAKVQIRSPFSGKLILTVEREKIVDQQIHMMEENTATIDLPVSIDYKPNVYISVSVIRSTQSLERHAPVRAFGVVPLMVDNSDNQLTIDLDLPEEMRPRGPLKISFHVKGFKDGRKSRPYITIAAVDEGVLQLTDFQTPDPFNFFFSKKRLEVESYDLYSAVLPEVEKTTSSSSPSGDREEAERKKRLIPITVTRVKPVALWSGLLRTDSRGRGSVTLDVPQFNGTLRVMAATFSGNQFGASGKDVIARDPIVLTPTYPRFISSRDKFFIPVSIFNGTGKKDRFEVTLDVEGPVEKPIKSTQVFTLKPEGEGQALYSLNALDGMGKVTFKLSAKGGGEETRITTDVPLRPPSPPITLTGSGVVKEGADGSFDFPGNWIQGTTTFDLTLSPFPLLQFAGSLQYLLRYPYGCAEQTTSKVFPLLYFNDLARLIEPELFGTRGADYFIQEGIIKLENMQLVDGGFSFWPRRRVVNTWTSVYVTHFLVEARKAGYEVSDRIYNRMIRALQRGLRGRIVEDWHRPTRAYACYVLAAAGKPNKSAMLYLKNNELDRMPDYSQFHLAGAFALSGDLNTAFSLFPTTVEPKEVKRETGRNFNSSTRAKAVMLDILAEVSPDHVAVPRLLRSLGEAASKRNRWYTTQENAFAFLALGKILRKQEPGVYKGEVTIDGKRYSGFESKDERFQEKEWGGKRVTIQIKGKGNCYYYWKAFGISKDPVHEYDKELWVRRTYYSKDGDLMMNQPFKQGDLIVAKISCRATTENLENVIITDLLPGGFEIENPRLESRAGIPWIGKRRYNPEYMDIRDDRLLLSVSLRRQQEMNFYYALRVVTRGDFILPPVVGEAMYDPAKSSVGSSGRIVVIE